MLRARDRGWWQRGSRRRRKGCLAAVGSEEREANRELATAGVVAIAKGDKANLRGCEEGRDRADRNQARQRQGAETLRCLGSGDREWLERNSPSAAGLLQRSSQAHLSEATRDQQ